MRASISSSSINSPPVGLRDAFSHGGTKPGILFKQAQHRILYQSLGIHTGTAGVLR
jgi:hypothetical protein